MMHGVQSVLINPGDTLGASMVLNNISPGYGFSGPLYEIYLVSWEYKLIDNENIRENILSKHVGFETKVISFKHQIILF